MSGMRIASKWRWFILVIIVFTTVSVGVVGYLGNHAIIRDLQTETLKKRAGIEVGRLNLAFSELKHDILFVRNLPMVRQIANSYNASSSDSERVKQELAQVFEQMLIAKPDYALIRLIAEAENGKELVRVDQMNGEIVRVAEEDLQFKGESTYYKLTREVEPDEIYYSDINLNREHGMIEVPIRPTLRVAMPVYADDGTFFGIVIINLNFQSYMDTVLGSNERRQRHQYYLTNASGFYLFHPNPASTFGFDLGFDLRVEDEFPQMKGFMASQHDAMTFRKDAILDTVGTLVHFEKFRVFGPHRRLAFGVVASYDDIGRASASLTVKIALAISVMTLLASMVAYWFSVRMTRPLERVTLAAKQLAENNHDGVDHLPLERDDEIGDLANTFKEMRDSIEQHRTNLLQANGKLSEMNRDLEHFAHISSHELREPIQRIYGLATLYQSECAHGHADDAAVILDQLNHECHRALLQIADFRDFSRITKDHSLTREEVSIKEVVVSVLDEFSDRLKQRNVKVNIHHLPTLNVYPNLVRVLYWHLVENALKHSQTDGFTLTFTATKDRSKSYVLGVRNTGSVIAEANVKTVFDIFKKLEKVNGSSGMGLAICRRIVDRHAGEIWIESDDDFVHFKFNLGTPSPCK